MLPFCIAQELTQRTGKNPNYQYVQIGCSQKAIAAMLQFARCQVGKPFSSMGMLRSMVYPRTTVGDSWYCAELVAACLQRGGLMSADSNPGAATPHSLYKLYKRQGAIMANPCTLRQQFGTMPSRPLALTAAVAACAATPPQPTSAVVSAPVTRPLPIHAMPARAPPASRRRSDSLPRMEFKTLQARGSGAIRNPNTISLSLSSLNMERRH